MGTYAITEEELNLLRDVKGHASMALNMACSVVEASTGEREARVDLAAQDLIVVFSFIRDCLVEVIEAGEKRSVVARHPESFGSGSSAP